MKRSLAAVLFFVACGDDSHPMPDANPYTQWSVFASNDTTDGALTCVWADGLDMFVTGGKGLVGMPGGGVILHYDGTAWSATPTSQFMWWTFGFTKTDAWAVGQGGLAMHYDGTMWTQTPTNFTGTLSGIWGAAPNDIWAVGGSPDAPPVPTILHWNGSQWSSAQSGTTETGTLFKVWGADATHVYAVGDRGIVLSWDGNMWTQAARATNGQLVTDCGTAANDVWAVGGNMNAAVLHFDGSQWMPLSDTGLFPPLLGCTVAADGTLVVVGRQGFIAWRARGGTVWNTIDPMPTVDCLHNVAPYSGGLIAVGGNLLAPASGLHGVMLRSGSPLGGHLPP